MALNETTQKLMIACIFQHISISIAVIGVFGNLISFIVLTRKKFKNHSFAFYIRAINAFDTFVLLTSFRHWAACVLEAVLALVSVESNY